MSQPPPRFARPAERQADAAEPFISIREVSKQFPGRNGTVTALQKVSLDIGRGEFVSVIGPSGCGKSTLMMMLAGLTPTSSGELEIDGAAINGPTRDLGIVFQQDALLEWRSALDNIVLQAEVRKMNIAAAREEAMRLLKMVGLDKFADAYPHELSGGMRQRVSICRALLHKPSLLVMDEPFGALDALTRDQLQIDLLRLRADRNMTILFITHSISEAVFLSDRIVVMSPRPGRIESVLPIDLPRPRRLAMRETPAFLGYMQHVTSLFESLGVLHED
jgi:NitT/TauT family transport system ATP-binding protein